MENDECREAFEKWKDENNNWCYIDCEEDAYSIWKAAWNTKQKASGDE